MRYLLSLGVTLAWGLWFGGLMTLFLLITAVFNAFGRTKNFQDAGNAIFGQFERYQLILASITILISTVWLLTGRTRFKWLLTALFLLAGAAAVFSTAYITPHLLHFKEVGDVADFGRFHGYSMLTYVMETGLLLIAGFVLPAEVQNQKPKA